MARTRERLMTDGRRRGKTELYDPQCARARSDAWEDQMFFLLQKAFRVIAHDRRGFGRSSQPAQGWCVTVGRRSAIGVTKL
jgi:hypothetical protein